MNEIRMKQRTQLVLLRRLVGTAKMAARWTLVIGCLVGWLAIALAGPVYAAETDADVVGPPVLVKDINTRTGDSNLSFTKAGDQLLIQEYVAGGEPRLWWSDGTPAGTVLLGQVALRGAPQPLNGFWYFVGIDRQHGGELWRTDGTAAGTQLVKEVSPGIDSGIYGYESDFVLANGLLFFVRYSQTSVPELWQSDGTAAGTAVLKAFPGFKWRAPALVKIDDTVYFTLYFDFVTSEVGKTVAQKVLWKSDGTAANTTVVKTFTVADELIGNVTPPMPVQEMLFYTADSTLWQSDGTTAGTILVGDYISTTVYCGLGCGFELVPGVRQLTAVNDLLFFAGYDLPSGWRLWRSDGTPAGTVPLANTPVPTLLGAYKQALLFTSDEALWITDPNGTTASRLLGDEAKLYSSDYADSTPAVANGQAYFVARATATDEAELWSTDGTAAGTARVKTIGHLADAGHVELTNIGDTLLLVADVADAGVQLWRSDGTTAGTTLVAIFESGITRLAFSFGLTRVGSKAVFVADDGMHGLEPWVSDGTVAGTMLLRDLDAQSGDAAPRQFTTVADRLLFVANDNEGAKLWQSDGSSINTTAILAQRDMLGNPLAIWEYEPYPVNETVFIALGTFDQGFTTTLWAGDANLTNFSALQTFGPWYSASFDFTTLNDRLYFTAGGIGRTPGFYQSDGTPAGTALVKTLPGNPLSAIVKRKEQLYFFTFAAGDTAATMQLWQSDGTATGTVGIASFDSIFQIALAVHDDALLFFGNNNQATELWRSDGTQAGSTLLKTISGQYIFFQKPTFYQLDNYSLFTIQNGAFELWRSDGTTDGTIILHTFLATYNPPLPTPAVVNGDSIFYAADDGVHGRELWLSDGTVAGTRLVADIATGAAAANPSGLQPVSDILLFAATDAQGIEAVWRTNSTGTRTQKVFDLGELRNPTEFALVGNHLFFNATSTTVGNELWAVEVSTTTALTTTVPAQIIGDRVGPHTIAIAVSNQGMAKAADVQLTVAFADGVTYLGNSRNAAVARNGNTVTLNLGTIGLWYETTVELYVQLPPTATAESRYAISYTVSAAGATAVSGQTELLLAPTERYFPLIKR